MLKTPGVAPLPPTNVAKLGTDGEFALMVSESPVNGSPGTGDQDLSLQGLAAGWLGYGKGSQG